MRRKNYKSRFIILLLVLLGSIGIGYAFLTQELTINGTGKVTASSWNIYFDNLVLNQGNVALSTGDVEATIDSSTLTDVTYTITLQKPGDFYEFTVDVLNDGTLDAMVGTVSNKLNNVEIDATHPLPAYLNYSVTYSDGIAIAPNHLLEANDSETYKVRLEYRTDITANDLPSTAQTLTLSFSVEYVQADANSITKPVPSFANDSWETIVANVHNGTIPDYYTVGSMKTVELGNGLGTHTVRIANQTTIDDCNNTNFSETACGFVIEFVDFVSSRRVNPWDSESTAIGNGNIGGWPASEIRGYLNTDVYNALPTILKEAIINTRVISGHGSTVGETNFTTTDKLYLLSTHEIWEDTNPSYDSYPISTYDSAYNQTRQLDYYKNHFVTRSNYEGAKKLNREWWLRSVAANSVGVWYYVNYSGRTESSWPTFQCGVSPAFRIG